MQRETALKLHLTGASKPQLLFLAPNEEAKLANKPILSLPPNPTSDRLETGSESLRDNKLAQSVIQFLLYFFISMTNACSSYLCITLYFYEKDPTIRIQLQKLDEGNADNIILG